MKIMKIILVAGIVIALLAILVCNFIINVRTKNSLFDKTENIPQNKTGLLLGTSKRVKSGVPNEYFVNRIEAAVELIRSGKIENIIISGDNSTKGYNEPQDMKNELVKRGIPEDKIYLDYAGLRTFDSVYRANYIFGQNSFTVISQKFHNERAIYIAKRLGLDAVGYNAADVDAHNGFKTNLREKFARVKVFIDFVFNKKPKYLGDPVHID